MLAEALATGDGGVRGGLTQERRRMAASSGSHPARVGCRGVTATVRLHTTEPLGVVWSLFDRPPFHTMAWRASLAGRASCGSVRRC